MQACLLTLLLTTGVINAEINTLEGDFVRGEIVGLNDNSLILRVGEEEQELLRESLLQVVSNTDEPVASAAITVELVDGSLLHASEFATQESIAIVQLGDGQSLQLPSDHVARVRFGPASSVQDADWQRILDIEAAGDVLVLRREADTLDYLEGFAGEVSPDSVAFTFEEEEYTVDRERVEGVLFANAASPRLAPLVCTLELSDGSRWQASQIVMEGYQWKVTTRTGLEVSLPVDSTRLLDFSGDKLVYLSSLTPDRQSWTPYLENGFPLQDIRYAPRFDESLDGGPLRLLVEREGHEQEMSFPRGLALHSRSELVYRLPAGFRRFQALVGIDERVRPHGSVWLEIQGDARTLFEGEISAVTAAGEPAMAVPLDLDIEGVSRLTIRVDFGEDQDVGDHLNLANAQIRK